MNTSMNTSENTTDRTSIDRASIGKTTRNRVVDQSEIRAMQIAVMLVLSTAYVTDMWQILAFQVGVFFVTIISPTLNPFIFFYRKILRPLTTIKPNWIKPDWRNDNMEAHRFASIIGLTISSAALLSLYTGHTDIGWGLVWLILGFGAFALSGWCAGCFAYYMIQKTGLGGYSLGSYFKHAPIQGSFPGVRPPK